DVTVTQCSTNGGAFEDCDSPFSPGKGDPLPAGSYTIVVRVADAAGNTASATRSFEIDPMAMCLAGGGSGAGDVTGTVEALTAATVEVWFRGQSSGDAAFWQFGPVPNGPFVALSSVGPDLVVTVGANVRHFPAATVDLTAWHHYAVVFTGTKTQL